MKLSGEALAGKNGFGIDYDTVVSICQSIKKCVDLGLQVGIVVGGGNFWRGRSSGKMDRTRADHMGMMATVINSLALADALEGRIRATSLGGSVPLKGKKEGFEVLTLDALID